MKTTQNKQEIAVNSTLDNVENSHFPYRVLLYYCFTPIENPEKFKEEHHLFCIKLGLRGRIIVADEGLNGTVCGTPESCQIYMDTLKNDSRFEGFKDIDFKIDASENNTFSKINVRLKKEIVHAGIPHIKPYHGTGTHLSPQEFKDLKDDEDVIILDVRSDYEHNLGHFKNAITLDIENFRDFPEKVKELEKYKDKKVLTYCTGGIKCEKASALLLQEGFKDVYQLHGGIIKYGKEVGGEDFDGKCYVFDERVAVDVNEINPTLVSTCYVCKERSDYMVNCANPKCNRHTTICKPCLEKMDGACSQECKNHPEKREYQAEGKGMYKKNLNGYNPYIGWNADKIIPKNER